MKPNYTMPLTKYEDLEDYFLEIKEIRKTTFLTKKLRFQDPKIYQKILKI